MRLTRYTITVRYTQNGDPHTVQYTPLATCLRQARTIARDRFTATHPGVEISSMRTQWKGGNRAVQTQHAAVLH